MKIERIVGLLSIAVAFTVTLGPPVVDADSNVPASIVFVCEHGAAKSIVAAAYFNKLAQERGLTIRAVSRGTEPQADLSPSAANGLRADGLSPTESKPRALVEHEAEKALRVVSFLRLPKNYYSVAAVEEWNDIPAVSEDYRSARDRIVAHLRALLDRLEAQREPALSQ